MVEKIDAENAKSIQGTEMKNEAHFNIKDNTFYEGMKLLEIKRK